MKIVLDLQACQASNCERGIGRYALSFAENILQQAGRHDIHLLLNNRFPESLAALRQTFTGLLPDQNIHLFESPGNIDESHPENAWRCRAAEQIRLRYIHSLAPDIVHVSSLFEGWIDDAVTSIIASTPPRSTAVTLFDLIPLLNQQIYLANPTLRRWYYRKLQSLKNAELLLSISEFSQKEAIAALHLPAEQVVNISTAIDEKFRPLGLSTAACQEVMQRHGLVRPFLMYTGGIDYRKNIEGLIEAFGRLPSQIRKTYQLAIVCQIDDSERRRLQTVAQRHGLGAQDLLCTGFVDDNDLIALYNCTKLFIFPSLHEGFGLPVLEAMACGAPVIGSDRSSIPEVIGRSDALFDPTSPPAIAAKIQQALSDDAYLNVLREHGRIQAQNFSWKNTAQRALNAFEALHERRQSCRTIYPAARPERPRLAYVSPLPPGKTGIADYSAELLPELARYYDIELITDQTDLTDDWLLANFPIRTAAWFKENAGSYDRIVYHFGNSAFHQHMFTLLEAHPGIVVLHDFFLSGVLSYIDNTRYLPGIYSRALYQSHGYRALIEYAATPGEETIWKYPCNKQVLDLATGVIVHSQYSRQLATDWYGPETSAEWQTTPLIRAMPDQPRRTAARQTLDIQDADFLVCVFGMLGPTKLNHEMLAAWLASALSQDKRCLLCFVGGNDADEYTDTLRRLIASSPGPDRIRITGFSSTETYRQYLAAADLAVQLRTRSRGETSASILDCLAYGIPTIINANGSATEIPEQIVIKLADQFQITELTQALEQIHGNAEHRQSLGQRGANHVRAHHSPAAVGRMYQQAIEHFQSSDAETAYRNMIRNIRAITATPSPNESDLLEIADCTNSNHLKPADRQLFVDVSELVQRDARSGIQRVVRNILSNLLENPPPGYRIEPVYDDGTHYRYARRFTLEFLGLEGAFLEDTYLETRRGDIFLGLDLHPYGIPKHEQAFLRLRNRSVKIYFVVYDLLPLLHPSTFIAGGQAMFADWLRSAAKVADGLICISRSVANELQAWLNKEKIASSPELHISYFHLGADIPRCADKTAKAKLPEQLAQHPSFLMVGTLEPRKSHTLVLNAFERLWHEGATVNLIIVGKKGWEVDELCSRLQNHAQQGRHLFWFEGINDLALLQLYETATALIAASVAEGFGLPLIEAAQHRTPLIVRDIPVFREVAGEHAFYFAGSAPETLAEALRQWLELKAAGKVPTSHGLPWLNWQQSTGQLLQCLFDAKNRM